ncbi:hypothetical protein AYI70_g7723 [Smittium culicis]|uniref:SCP domain-containing protein n=1 Tax=Smittium culicis TaxID=133412 RepID=A0A1R1XJ82_9FUNG|nr:hypothetical protein AYI70_g7723 [Smittium culicis]
MYRKFSVILCIFVVVILHFTNSYPVDNERANLDKKSASDEAFKRQNDDSANSPDLKKFKNSAQDINDMTKMINDIRRAAKKSALKYSESVAKAAYIQAQYMNTSKKMTHDNPIYKSVGSRFVAAGSNCMSCAENVAFNQNTVGEVMDAWKNSPGHYANIIGEFSYYGFAKVGPYWSQTFKE